MVKKPELLHWCTELLSPLGSVSSRSMFGGWGIYLDGLFMALIADDQFYLKADALSRAHFVQAGCTPFTYAKSDGSTATLSYYLPPAEALESPEAMRPWARLALEAALRAKAAPVRPAKPRPPQAPRTTRNKASPSR